MRKELLYSPGLIIERLAEIFSKSRRRKRLKHTVAQHLQESQLASLEFLELIRSKQNVSVIYDLGANAGTWSLLAHAIFPEAQVHAFEPLPVYQQQFERSTEGVSEIKLHKVATGNSNKIATFNISGHSSSFLEVSEELVRMFPNEKKTGEAQVQMVRLDDYVAQHNLPFPQVMKLDIEGFEIEALKNSTECLQHCNYLICETSFVERHIGQPLFHDLVAFLAQHHFFLCAFPLYMHLGQEIKVADILFEKRNR